MISQELFFKIVYLWIILALVIFPLLLRINPPYGRYTDKRWGARINNRLGWTLMELPSLLFFTILFLSGDTVKEAPAWIFFSLWVIHYSNRIFIFPLRIRTKGKKMPLTIIFAGSLFNLMNAFLNGYWLGSLSPVYPVSWLYNPIFITGISIFVVGFILNQVSDTYLISLRAGGKTGYFIPRKGMFSYVSCPNFLGEIIQWTGFAIMTWSLPGLSFAIWTAANLIPRALHHHDWYRREFDDYPSRRKAVIPGIL